MQDQKLTTNAKTNPPAKRRWRNLSNKIGPQKIFDHSDFYKPLVADMRSARGLILCQSPYLALNAIERYIAIIKDRIDHGVVVCFFVQEPREWARRDDPSLPELIRQRLLQLQGAISLLKSVGGHVTLVKEVHAKLLIIDGFMVWDGSMNIFSHHSTTEHLNQTYDRARADELIRRHRLSCPVCLERGLLSPNNTDPEEYAKQLGRRIAESRIAIGLSQQELAQRLKTRQAVISQIERGYRHVNLLMVTRVCREIKLALIAVPDWMVPSVEQMVRRPK